MLQMESVWRHRQLEHGPCSDCPGCDSPYPLGGLGSPDADIMLIAMEPAYNVDVTVTMQQEWDDAKRKLMLERELSGNSLWQHMENVASAADQEPRDLYFTNIAKCNSDSDFDDRAQHCMEYLPGEILEVDPKLILLHGGNVLNVTSDMFNISYDSVGDVHGTLHSLNTFQVLPLYHWRYSYRQGNVEEYNTLVATAVSSVL